MKQIIGFGDEYYTLWESSGEGRPRYIKNISKDLETAKKQYPNAEVDLGLHGERWESWEPVEVEHYDDRFNFGKYEGLRFEDCGDDSYMKWYANQLFSETQEWKNLTDVLKTFGYGVDNGRVYDPEEWEYHCECVKEREEFEQLLERGLPFEEEFEYNHTSFSLYGFACKFENTKEMGNSYYGTYYLPVDSKGKAKRIKGKTVRMTKYEVVEDEIIIKEFEIL